MEAMVSFTPRLFNPDRRRFRIGGFVGLSFVVKWNMSSAAEHAQRCTNKLFLIKNYFRDSILVWAPVLPVNVVNLPTTNCNGDSIKRMSSASMERTVSEGWSVVTVVRYVRCYSQWGWLWAIPCFFKCEMEPAPKHRATGWMYLNFIFGKHEKRTHTGPS
jgi:hypothetical protein